MTEHYGQGMVIKQKGKKSKAQDTSFDVLDDLAALIAKRDELLAQADALQKQKEDESKVFQERRHWKRQAYTVNSIEVRNLRDMASAYSRTIAKLTGV